MTSDLAPSDGHALREEWFADADTVEPRFQEIEAIVEHGDARGRTMGFPTANMHLDEGFPLGFGIYAVRIAVMAQARVASRHDGVANFGIRPMYRIARPLLEAHLFDFDGDLYGKTLRVQFVSFIRPEANFSSLDALIAQIASDAAQARRLLGLAARQDGLTAGGDSRDRHGV